MNIIDKVKLNEKNIMKSFTVTISILLLILFSCKKDKIENLPDPSDEPFTKALIEGKSQKGPFLNSSSLTLFELDNSFAQTGNSFNTQIVDNLGSFQISNINIQTSYAKLKADGFYFNEISNSNSSAPISLYALSDLSNKNSVNINLLSTLEVSRIEYLLSNGSTFNDAKQQAQTEILNIFSINKVGIAESELLDISVNGDDNAILLAVSLILQGYRTEAELTQLLGDISTDIRTDGILNSPTSGTALINDAQLLNLPTIRTNIENKYTSLGVTTIIPDFEKYINQFIDSTNYNFTKIIEYPYIVNTKKNLIKDTTFQVTGGTPPHSIGAYLPTGTSLKVVVKRTPGYPWNFGTLTSPSYPVIGWTTTHYPGDSIVFFGIGNNQIFDYPVMVAAPSSIDIDIYENNSSTPTRTKTIMY